MDRAAELKKAFAGIYPGEPRIFRAPGRVNLIGEHTDYNDGFVMPCAIAASTWVAIAPRPDRRLVAYSQDFSEHAEIDLDDPPPGAEHHWSRYVFGVAWVLESAGHRLRGANLLIKGDVPIGAGLSSSAAIEVATGCALLAASEIRIERVGLAKFCQRAENQFVGTRCGIMDQFVSCFGAVDSALMLDCRTLEHHLVRIPPSVTLAMCNTMVKHELASGEYNKRREECERGTRTMAKKKDGVRALRDVTLEDLNRSEADLPGVVYRRCRHVVSENARVTQAVEALHKGDLARFGALMGESHTSLRDDYEVSCSELDLMVDLARQLPGVYGARMTGGGFGGCTINLVRNDCVERFKEAVSRGYAAATGKVPEIYTSTAGEGAGEVRIVHGAEPAPASSEAA